ncbi:MAG: MarR family winged helix-turn-helix transcriptional regulator [Fimbriimonadales bacterium]
MNLFDEAVRLEALIPKALTALFHSGIEDPLRHHSVGQIRLMRTLSTGSKTATELSKAMGLSPSSLTQMASRMIRAGLVAKELDSQDRRVRKLSLTPAGALVMEQRQAMRACAAAKLLERMDPKRLQDLMELLEEIRDLKCGDDSQQPEAIV